MNYPAEIKALLDAYWCSTRNEFTSLARVTAVLSRPISSMSNIELGPVLSEAAPISEGGSRFFPVKFGGVSSEDGGNCRTIDAPVRLDPPSGVPSEAVADIRCSHVARKRAARALSYYSTIEPCPPRAIADAAMRPRSFPF